jgi:thiamine biosynthesis lipoprotein
MATRFELVLYGDDPVRLRAAGEEALQEIEQLEAQLSFYSAGSEIRWINRYAAERPIKVEPRLFALLRRCADLNAATEGAFDVTIGPLMRAWRFVGGSGGVPTPAELNAARSVVGFDHVVFDDQTVTLRFTRPGVELDLGAYGKGYAIEQAMALLIEHGVSSALLHGGTSSVVAIGAPPGEAAWQISLGQPLSEDGQPIVVSLANQALSVSAIHGKSFIAGGREYGHVIDPRRAAPVDGAQAAAVIGSSAAECEALSTALLVRGAAWLPRMAERFPDYRGLVASPGPSRAIKVKRSAQWPVSNANSFTHPVPAAMMS